MYKVITNEHLEYIKEHPDLTDRELGEILNVNYSTIRNARHRLGIYKDKKFNISKEDYLNIYKECNERLDLMSNKLNINRKTLRKIAKEYEIKTDKLLDLTQDDIENICAKYNDCTANELAKKYNCSASKIAQIWRQQGLIGKTNRIYHLDESYFDEINTPAKAYYVGLIASDGCIYTTDNPNKSYIVKISLSAHDEMILKLLKYELKTEKPISYTNVNNCNYATLEICSNKITNSLIALGLDYKKKTYGNTIPNIQDGLMPHFIRGYFDGDGSIPNSYNNISDEHKPKVYAGISGYRKNMDKFIYYLESKNIYTTFTLDQRHYNGDDEFGALSVSNIISVYCFLKLIYNNCGDFYIDRKKILADNLINYIESRKENRYKQAITYYKYAVQTMC